MSDYDELETTILAHLTARRGEWFAPASLAGLAPITEQRGYAHRHELDEMDSGENLGFYQDVVGGARPAVRRGPDLELLTAALERLATKGAVSRRAGIGDYNYGAP